MRIEKSLKGHTGEKPFRCAQKCAESFALSANLQEALKSSLFRETPQLLPVNKVICPGRWITGTVQNSHVKVKAMLYKIYLAFDGV